MSSVLSRASMLSFLLAAAASAQDPGVRINSGETVVVDVPAVSGSSIIVSESFFVDVGGGARDLYIEIDSDSGRDFDLVIRPDEPFPMSGSANEVFALSEFNSGSTFSREFVHVQDFATSQLANRRWFFAILGFSGAEAQVSVSATVSNRTPPRSEVLVDFDNLTGASDCDTSFWNDSAPFTPEGNNNAATVGEARRAAMLRAADELAAELTSRVPVVIRACWGDRGEAGPNGGITLAAARTNRLPINTPGLRPNTAYSQAAGTRLAGTDVCRLFGDDDCNQQDVFIFFNIHAASRYYYGLRPAVDGDGTDFISVAMHEITHGLGYFELSDQAGTLPVFNGQEVTDAYLHQLITVQDGEVVRLDDPSVSDATRAAAFVSFDNLLWADDQVNISTDNTLLSFPGRFGHTRMEAPAAFSGGSSVSHISGAYCDIMRPSFGLCRTDALRDLNLSRKVLHGVGWFDRPSRADYVGLYYDRTREGHGFDLQIGGFDANGNPIYVLTFYSYETLGGAPEWFQAIGTIKNGAFSPIRNPDQMGMPQYFYDAANSPPQQADPGRFAQAALSFNDPGISPACTDGVQRPGAELRSSFQWAIDNLTGEWCAEPLIPSGALPRSNDFGGLWFAGASDEGWGFSLENIVRADGSVDVFVLLYVYAADGTPVWFFGQAAGFVADQPLTITMFQRTGYSRRSTSGQLSDAEAGTMILTLGDPSNPARNLASVDVTYLGQEGGSWLRNEVAVQRLSVGR